MIMGLEPSEFTDDIRKQVELALAITSDAIELINRGLKEGHKSGIEPAQLVNISLNIAINLCASMAASIAINAKENPESVIRSIMDTMPPRIRELYEEIAQEKRQRSNTKH